MSESTHLVDETSGVLSTFVQNDEQTFEQFTNLFQSIDVGTQNTSDENIDGMLSYLQNREDGLVTGACMSDDTGIFSIVSSATPEPQTTSQIVDSFSNSGLQCLDVMMNHLRARELALERSPEYSVELNFGSRQAQNDDASHAMDFIIDNRLQPASENSENCSSDIPDNDRIAALQNARVFRTERRVNNSSDDIEVIELEPTSGRHIENCMSNQSTIVDFMKQSANLKIDNFVSDECAYDSDKDIDESEHCTDTGETDIDRFVCKNNYVPSFYTNDDDNNSMSNYHNTDDSEFTLPIASPPTEQSLPGECIDNDRPDTVIHIRPLASNSITCTEACSASMSTVTGTQSCSETVTESNNDSVEQFYLDPNFNYDNAEITPRLSHYR